MNRLRTLMTSFVALIAAFVLPAAASAQMMGGMGMTQPFSTQDVSDMTDFLSMNEDQTGIVMDMHSAYFANWNKDQQTLSEAFQAGFEEAQANNDMTIYQEISKMLQAFEVSSAKNLDRLFDDVQLLLNEDQLTRWPPYELRSFRQRTLPTVSGQGLSISGASTDLIGIYEDKIVSELDDEEVKANLQGILASYEREMDTVLHTFIKVKDETTEESLEIGMDWMNNMETIETILKKFTDAAIEVRDVNDRYQGRIAAAIPDEPRAFWETAYNLSAAPAVYTPNYLNEAFGTASELGDITEDQKSQVTDLEARYTSTASNINTKWAKALRESEENISLQSMMQGQTQSGEAAEFRKQRKELDAQIYDQLASLLTEEQREKLPAKPSSNWRERFQFSNGQ